MPIWNRKCIERGKILLKQGYFLKELQNTLYIYTYIYLEDYKKISNSGIHLSTKDAKRTTSNKNKLSKDERISVLSR